jgi:hypothetical protein
MNLQKQKEYQSSDATYNGGQSQYAVQELAQIITAVGGVGIGGADSLALVLNGDGFHNWFLLGFFL